ncbi:MAG: molybdenum cofactor guanylyltransferase [Rubripirellula sp.]
MTQRVLGVVLAGGRSMRMGRDKAALPHPDGGTFLEHSIRRLSSICDFVVVSGSSSVPHDAKTLEDPVNHRGPATGIATALQFCLTEGFDAAIITPVDTPSLSTQDVQCLLAHWQKTGRVTLAQTGKLQPLIGIYPAGEADLIRQLADSDDCSLVRWFESRNHEIVSLSELACRNVNAPADLPQEDPHD